MVDWNSEHWGEDGQNVTFAANGSWVLDAHGEEVTQS